MGHYELISACFFWKISSKKSTFLRFTHQNLLAPPPPNFTLVVKFFYFFFWWLPLIVEVKVVPNLNRA